MSDLNTAPDDGAFASTIGERVLDNTSSLLPEGRSEQDQGGETFTKAEWEEAGEIGHRDGYESAVQDIDLMTGGDGEYRFCTDGDPERHTPDPATMKARIAARFDEANADLSAARLRIKALEEGLRDADAGLSEYACMIPGPFETCIRSPDQCQAECGKAATEALGRIQALLSSAQGETKEGFDGLPELPCGEQPGATVPATAALALSEGHPPIALLLEALTVAWSYARRDLDRAIHHSGDAYEVEKAKEDRDLIASALAPDAAALAEGE